jgi:molecular chaperone DnaJ
MRATVPFATLALGGELEITTISDKKLSVKIAAGTQIGDRLRVRGAGMPAIGGSTGDLYIEIGTTVPSKLSRAQKRALEDFAGNS